MTPANSAIRNPSSLLLGLYLEAAEITGLDIRVDQGAEEPVSKVYQRCRHDLKRLAKEESE